MTIMKSVVGVSRRNGGLLLIALGVLAGSLISASAASAQTLVTLVNFNGTNGQFPTAGLIADGNGDLFGTTLAGGSTLSGNVFEVAKSTGGFATAPTTLADFDGINFAYPTAGLATDSNGNLFGTTDFGGAYGAGNVFEIAKGTTGFAAITTLVSFNGTNGQNPVGGLTVDSTGNLFGTTEYGGSGYGNAYEVANSTSGYATTPTTLASFDGNTDYYPFSNLLIDSAGNLFGTTEYGGVYGNVFEIAKTTTGYAAPVTIANFDGTTAAYPFAGLVADANGDLFGTTANGGTSNDGTVFEIVKTTSGYTSTPTILVTFNGTNGANPNAGLIMDSNGSLFGTTEAGGASGAGTVFEVAKTSSGFAATPTVVISFDGASGGGDVLGGLIADSSGNLYGTTAEGGSSSDGTVFEITGSGFMPPTQFAGTPGTSDCKGATISALAHTYGGIAHAAKSLGYSSVADLQNTVAAYCSN